MLEFLAVWLIASVIVSLAVGFALYRLDRGPTVEAVELWRQVVEAWPL